MPGHKAQKVSKQLARQLPGQVAQQVPGWGGRGTAQSSTGQFVVHCTTLF